MRALRLLTATLILLFGRVVYAQQAPAGTPAHGPIKLDVVVTQGRNGKPVADLPQGAFTVLDNGAAQPLQSFRAVSGKAEPVKVLLVIDAVNIDFQRVAYARQQIEQFLRANDGKLSQPTAVAIFTDTGTQIAPNYTTDGNALSAALEKQAIGLRELRRSAGFYGAEERLDLSLKTMHLLLARNAAENGRKFVLWISPGWPLLSGPAVNLSSSDEHKIFQQAVAFSDELRRANATMYVVDPLGAAESPGRAFFYEEFVKGVRKPSQAALGDLGAQVFAVQSGGLFLSGSNDLTVLLGRCFADAQNFYELTYQAPPAEAANEYHRTEVRVNDARLVARTRQGYYSQP
jgi:VWFA-related protein